MQNVPAITQHLSPELAQIFLEGLPEHIRNGLEMRAKTMNYPVWAVIEMARCLRHATRTQAISMKKLYPLLIVSLNSTSDRPFWDASAGGVLSAIAFVKSKSAICLRHAARTPCRMEKLRSLPIFMTNSIQEEARQILDTLAFTPFDLCHPLSRDFDTIPARVGLYAFRHRIEGLLYIGKAKNLRDRLRGGHKAFLWSWLDRYDPDDVRIAYVTLNQWQRPGLSYELETLILQATNPPYNVKITSRTMTQTLNIQHLPPEAIHSLIPHLPDYVKVALLQKAAELECSLEAAIEMAIASFLDSDAFSFEDCLLSQRLKDSKQG